MEGDWHPHESNDLDDGAASADHHCPAQDDEWSRGKARNGADAAEYEHAESGHFLKQIPIHLLDIPFGGH